MAAADESITITGVERKTHGRADLWHVSLRLPDGSAHCHVMPTETMEWRAAEYGIDPADTDTLLDIVLAEAFMDDGIDHTHPRSLQNAATIDDAREFHLARVAAVKARRKFTGPGHRKRMRDESPIHPEALALKRQLVDGARRRTRAAQAIAAAGGQAGPALTADEERVARLRRVVKNLRGS